MFRAGCGIRLNPFMIIAFFFLSILSSRLSVFAVLYLVFVFFEIPFGIVSIMRNSTVSIPDITFSSILIITCEQV